MNDLRNFSRVTKRYFDLANSTDPDFWEKLKKFPGNVIDHLASNWVDKFHMFKRSYLFVGNNRVVDQKYNSATGDYEQTIFNGWASFEGTFIQYTKYIVQDTIKILKSSTITDKNDIWYSPYQPDDKSHRYGSDFTSLYRVTPEGQKNSKIHPNPLAVKIVLTCLLAVVAAAHNNLRMIDLKIWSQKTGNKIRFSRHTFNSTITFFTNDNIPICQIDILQGGSRPAFQTYAFYDDITEDKLVACKYFQKQNTTGNWDESYLADWAMKTVQGWKLFTAAKDLMNSENSQVHSLEKRVDVLKQKISPSWYKQPVGKGDLTFEEWIHQMVQLYAEAYHRRNLLKQPETDAGYVNLMQKIDEDIRSHILQDVLNNSDSMQILKDYLKLSGDLYAKRDIQHDQWSKLGLSKSVWTQTLSSGENIKYPTSSLSQSWNDLLEELKSDMIRIGKFI